MEIVDERNLKFIQTDIFGAIFIYLFGTYQK